MGVGWFDAHESVPQSKLRGGAPEAMIGLCYSFFANEKGNDTKATHADERSVITILGPSPDDDTPPFQLGCRRVMHEYERDSSFHCHMKC